MKLKEKIKDSYRVISFKTKRSKLDTKKMDNKAIEKPPASVIGQIIKIFIHFTHRLFTIFLRAILWRLKGKGQSMPPIKDLVLLETATSLAIKIRTKKVMYLSLNILPEYKISNVAHNNNQKIYFIFRLNQWML